MLASITPQTLIITYVIVINRISMMMNINNHIRKLFSMIVFESANGKGYKFRPIQNILDLFFKYTNQFSCFNSVDFN